MGRKLQKMGTVILLSCRIEWTSFYVELLQHHRYYYWHYYQFFTQLVVFHRSQSDYKSTQVSRTLLSILADLNNAVVWVVSSRPPTFKSSSPFNNPLVTVPKATITIVTYMFHNFFNSLSRSRYLSFFSHSFSFILWSAGTAKSTILQILLFFFFLFVDYYLVWSSGRD